MGRAGLCTKPSMHGGRIRWSSDGARRCVHSLAVVWARGQRCVADFPPPWPPLPSVVVNLLHHSTLCHHMGMAARAALDLPAFFGGSGGGCWRLCGGLA
jgi:hypothetical protein